jgi:hypothetical protein
MVKELFIFAASVISLICLLVYLRRGDGRRLKQSVKESLSESLRSDIEAERELALGKKQKFEAAMKKASK